MEENNRNKDPAQIELERRVFVLRQWHPISEAKENAHKYDQDTLIEDVDVFVPLYLIWVCTNKEFDDDPHAPEVQDQGDTQAVNEDDREAKAYPSTYEDQWHQYSDIRCSSSKLQLAVLVHWRFHTVICASILISECRLVESSSVFELEVGQEDGKERQ